MPKSSAWKLLIVRTAEFGMILGIPRALDENLCPLLNQMIVMFG